MKQINIEIIDMQLDELGIDQEPKFTAFRFNEAHFIGYWISESTRADVNTVIKVYIGNFEFICKHTAKNIELFESILNR